MSKNKFPNNIVFDYCIPNGVDKDWKNIIGCFLFYIKDINSVIKAETIEKIIFAIPETYEEAVKHVDKNQKVSNGSLAITLTNKNDDNTISHHIIFNLTPYFFENLKYNKDTILNFPYLNILSHEMAHIDLINNLHEIDDCICFANIVNQIEKRRFLVELKRAFEEFFACKLSCSFYPDNELEQSYKNHIFTYLEKISENQEKFIKNYQINNDYQSYFENSYKLLLNLFIYCGYYLGCRQENSQLIQSNFIDMKRLENIFNQLYEYFYNIGKYRETINLNIFDDLINYFEEILEEKCFIKIDRINNRINTPKLKMDLLYFIKNIES